MGHCEKEPGRKGRHGIQLCTAFVADWKEIDKDSPDIMKMGHY